MVYIMGANFWKNVEFKNDLKHGMTVITEVATAVSTADLSRSHPKIPVVVLSA